MRGQTELPARSQGAPDALARATESLREHGPRIAGWALPFALVSYLGLRGGGYDAIVRGELGFAVWWFVLLGALLGILPAVRLDTAGWVGLGALAAFAVWTAAGVGWSESSERSVAEVSRVATYLGVFVLALSVQREGGLRRTIHGITAGLTLIGLLALLSRLHPSWFPDSQVAQFQTSVSERLSYPVNYWNGLAALMAMALPLLLSCAAQCRSLIARALAAGAIPAIALTAFLTLSRGGAIECAGGIVALMVLARRRLALLPTVCVSAVGSAILIAAVTKRDALGDGLLTPAAADQGDQMLAMVLVVCAGVALIQVAIALADKYRLIRIRIPRRRARTVLGVAAIALIAVLIAAGAPELLADSWQDFKGTGSGGREASRFTSASGNGRYQFWASALDANRVEPLTGIGPGTFEFWWAREGSLPGFVRDAHSLYMESLAEIGIVGCLLIAGFIVGVIALGAWRSLRGPGAQRTPRAAATSAAVAFAIAAGVDWAWELTVLPVVFLLLAAVILAPRPETAVSTSPVRNRAARAGLAALALVALITIAVPLTATIRIRQSQADFRAKDFDSALKRARSAADLQPYAATPDLQQALVLEAQGDLPAARNAAVSATRKESTNWRTWLVLSRLEGKLSHPRAATDAYQRARDLNPRSAFFARSGGQS